MDVAAFWPIGLKNGMDEAKLEAVCLQALLLAN